MHTLTRTRVASFLLLVGAAVLGTVPGRTQPARPQAPPDISGEWSLENHEDPGALGAQGQPPLGD